MKQYTVYQYCYTYLFNDHAYQDTIVQNRLWIYSVTLHLPSAYHYYIPLSYMIKENMI